MADLPQSSRSYAILGTGALGGFYGSRLQRAGLDVHFLLHSDYEHVLQHGLKIDSVEGNFVLPRVQAYSSPAKMPACDVAIVALKATQNHLLPQLLPPVLKPEGVVVLLQNGLGGEPEVAQIVGSERVIGALGFICSHKVGPGHIHHLDYGALLLAEYGPDYKIRGITPRLQQIQADLILAGIRVSTSEDLLLARWQKLVWNIPFNSLSVIFGATTDEMMADPHSRKLVEAIMAEVRAAASACGRHISADYVQDLLARTKAMQPYRTSMMLDYERQQPLEAEAIVGIPLRMAQQRGAQLPLLEMLYHQLQFLDAHHPERLALSRSL